MGICLTYCAQMDYGYVLPLIIGAIQVANFGGLIPTESSRSGHGLNRRIDPFLQTMYFFQP
jgi:hypothetical protein